MIAYFKPWSDLVVIKIILNNHIPYSNISAGLPGVKVRTTHRMNSDTFNSIVKLGAGLKKKKKKGKGKKVSTE